MTKEALDRGHIGSGIHSLFSCWQYARSFRAKFRIPALQILFKFLMRRYPGTYFRSMNLTSNVWDNNWMFTSGATLSAPAINGNCIVYVEQITGSTTNFSTFAFHEMKSLPRADYSLGSWLSSADMIHLSCANAFLLGSVCPAGEGDR